MPTEKVVAHLYGPRNQITGQCVIPAHLIGDFDRYLAECQAAYPTFTAEWLVRYIWMRGLDSVRAFVESSTIPNPNTPPKPSHRKKAVDVAD